MLETDESGAVSAYAPGLPVYAAADSHAKAERAIRAVLTAYLQAHPHSRPEARVRVARLAAKAPAKVDIVGTASSAHIGARRRSAPRDAMVALVEDLARLMPVDDRAREPLADRLGPLLDSS